MPLDLKDIKEATDKDWTYGQTPREMASNDLVFYWITHWDDQMLDDSQLAYRGEFDILRKAGRQIMSDLRANPIQVDFEPKNETREDAADLVDGMYRGDDNYNTSIEAYDVAKQEAVVCGVGAWELFTEYVSMRDGNNLQVIRRLPIHEANNTVIWDSNAKLLDKSDADRCGILIPYSEDGYKKLVYDLTGEEIDHVDRGTFKYPEQSYAFPWIGGTGKIIHVVKFFYREKIKEKILTLIDPFQQSIVLRESTLANVMDEMLDAGFKIQSEKSIERWQVTKYIASGADILSSNVIVGENIPIVPVFGERAYVEGEEYFEGVTRLAKDPQRLRDFQLSYLADIVSRSPREKPIFAPEQVKGFEPMYEITGADNNYSYVLQNLKTLTGDELPLGPVGTLPGPEIPSALVASIELSRQAVEDVANPGIPQDIADPDLSGKAVIALQNRIDMQSMVYQEHYKHAKRRDGEIWVSMASEIYDTPRKVTLVKPDGSRQDAQIMQTVIDQESGDLVVINDLSNSEFEVYSQIGQEYSSKKEQTIEKLTELYQGMDQQDPKRQIIMLKILRLMDGVDFDDIREYANKQLVLAGIKKPETKEEQALLLQAQQAGNQPDPAMILAQAEYLKGQADVLREQRENAKFQINSRNELMKLGIDVFKAQTDRMGVEIDAKEADANIKTKDIEAFGKSLDNTEKIINIQNPGRLIKPQYLNQRIGAA